MLAFVVSKLVGLARDRAIAHQFGSGPETDAYFAAFRIPDLLFTLVAGGALVSAFLPVFSEAVNREGKDRAWRTAGGVTNTVFGITAVLAALSAVFAAPLIQLLAPGFPPATQHLAVELMRIVLLSTLVFAVSGLQMAILNTFHHFLMPAIAPAVYNAGILFGAVVLVPRYGVHGVAYGVVIGALGHLLIKVPALIRHGYRYVATFGWGDTQVRQVFLLMGPRVLALATVQVVWFVTVRLASGLEAGALSSFQYGWQLAQMPQTILGTAIAIVAFPTLAELSALRQRTELAGTLNSTLTAMLALSVPAAVGMFVLSGPAVDLVLVTGEFGADAASSTTAVLRMLSVGLVAHVVLELIARAFYAQQDTTRPLYFAVLAMLLNVVLAALFVAPMGVSGLALANSLAVSVEVLVAVVVLRRMVAGVAGRDVTRSLGKVAAASTLMAAAMIPVLASVGAAAEAMGIGPFVAGLIGLAAGGLVGGAVYLAVALALGLDAIREPARALAARLPGLSR